MSIHTNTTGAIDNTVWLFKSVKKTALFPLIILIILITNPLFAQDKPATGTAVLRLSRWGSRSGKVRRRSAAAR